jgi:ribosome-binding protein aMBF1 (putative translation factor)
MITTAQIRAARAMVGASLEDLASDAKLAPSLIESIESNDGTSDAKALLALRHALEARGIVFLANGSQESGGPGIRLKSWEEDEGIRPENLNATNDD